MTDSPQPPTLEELDQGWLPQVVDSSSDVVYVKDRLTRHLFVNRRFEELFGVKRAEVLGKTNAELFPDHAGPLTEHDMRVLESGLDEDYEETLVVGGVARVFRSRKFPLRDRTGAIVAVCGRSMDVTAQRLTQAQLRREQELTARLVESSRDGILAFDRECRFTVWNSAMERIWGLVAAEVLGRRAVDVLPFLVTTGEERYFHEALAGRQAASSTPYAIPQSGRQGHFEGHYGPLHDERGNVTGGLAIVRDVTERRRSEDARVEAARVEAARGASEDALRRFAFLADIGEVLASSLDLDRTLAEVARLAVPLLGDVCIVDLLEEGALRGVATAHVDPTKQALLADMRKRYPAGPEVPSPAGRVLATGKPELIADVTPGEIAAHTLDREHAELITRLGFHSSIAIPLVVRGAMLGAFTIGITESDRRYGPDDLAFAQDVARRASLAIDNARLYGALRGSEDRFRTILEQSPLSTQLIAPSGFTTGVNRAWEKLWGIKLEQLADYDMLSDPQLEASGVTPLLRRAFAGEAVEIHAIRYDPDVTLPDRSANENPARWVRAFAYPIKTDDGRVREVVLVHEDVTKRVEMETRLLEEDRRKDEFLATLAHELRNPLAPLRTGIELLRRTGTSETAATHAVMERQLAHMVRLLDDLLDVSRIRRGKIELRPAPVSVGDVLRAATELSKPQLDGAGLAFSARSEEGLVVMGDATRLAQVVSNLLNNAAKYTPRGGSVTLDARRAGGEVEIAVQDSGIGIAGPLLERVFEMFSQVRADGSGLGVGLTLARRLVELHGGRIWAESEGEGRGTRIVVRLPASDQRPLETAPASSSAAPRSAKAGRRVLVVDDNEDAAEMLSALLELDGHDVRTASDGPTALAIAREHRPEVAFLDIGMPGMDGHELARRLRAMTDLAPLRLVALTGWGQDEDRRRSREAGFDDHLTKPVSVDAVRAVVSTTA